MLVVFQLGKFAVIRVASHGFDLAAVMPAVTAA